jgi:flavin reductase (DIM6/NTAB) family NADH-FMN oxidoreductase RutF
VTQGCDPIQFRDVIGRFASGVTVLSARDGEADHGMTASAICSLSLEPPMLLACVNRAVPTREAITRSGVFAVNVLHEGQGDVARHFAAPRADKFAGVDARRGALGTPLLPDALAWLECRVTQDIEGGTHSVFLAEVVHAEAREGRPLAYFRGGFGRLEPPATPADAFELYAGWT